MSQVVNGYINDLSAIRDNIKLRVRVLRAWMQPIFGKPNVSNLELIVMNEQATRVQVQIRKKLVNQYKHQLQEGSVVMLQHYSLDVIGQVVACDDLDCFDKNGKSGKKKPLTLIDAQNNEMRCTLWGEFAQQFSDFLNQCADHTRIIAVLHLCMMKMWDGKMGVQNGYNATKLFLFNGKDSILASEFSDVEEFRQRLLGVQIEEKSEHTASRISTASRYSTKDDFVTKYPLRQIAELLDVKQGEPSVIVGTICAIIEEDGWWYLGCGKCKKKVVKTSDIVDLEAETMQKPGGGRPNGIPL